MYRQQATPFEARSDWEHNACVSSYMQFIELGDYYLQAADALVRIAISDQSLLDVYVYPVCFLYRHAVELILKDWLWKSDYVAHGTKEFPKNHDLCALWPTLSANCHTILGPDFPLTVQETDMLQQALAQIEERDPRSDAFRYPFDTKGHMSHSSLTHVNFRSLYESVHQVVNSLATLGELVAYCHDRESEADAERPDGHAQ